MTKLEWTHQEPSEAHTHRLPESDRGALTSLAPSYVRWIHPTGYRRVMDQKKVKVKSLEATKFSKMLSVKIILKLKRWAQKFYNLKSYIFRLDSCWSKSHKLESTHSIWFEKHQINTLFSWYSRNRKYIFITVIFGTYTFSGTWFTNIYLWYRKWPSITITWLIIRKRDTGKKSYATQQTTQSGTECTRLPGSISKLFRFFFVEFIWLIWRRLL